MKTEKRTFKRQELYSGTKQLNKNIYLIILALIMLSSVSCSKSLDPLGGVMSTTNGRQSQCNFQSNS